VVAIRRKVRRILDMSPVAWFFTLGSLKLAVACLFCAFIILIDADTYYLRRSAAALVEIPLQSIILLGLAGLIWEDFHRNRGK